MLLGSEGAGLTDDSLIAAFTVGLPAIRSWISRVSLRLRRTLKVLWEIMLGGTSFLPPLEALVAAATLEMIMYVL